MQATQLYFKMIWVDIRSQMQYRASFIMGALANMMSSLTEYVGILLFFDRFQSLGQWKMQEVMLFYGIINIAFALSEAFGRGFDTFHRHVRMGEFDRVLVRPRSPALQVLGSEFQLLRIGRFIQGLVILLISIRILDLSWGVSHILLLIWAILGGMLLFTGLYILQATSTFWTVQSIEVWNTATYGGVYALQYPMDIYQGFLRKFFTVIVPLASINYWPCAYLLGKGYVPEAASFMAPLCGVMFFAVSLMVWQFGVRHYKSTGS